MQIFQDLGAFLENAWRARNYDEEVFPELATVALQEYRISEQVEPWDVVKWVHHASTLPEQKDINANFGEPPITVFTGSRFYIDIYFWLEGTTSIHQHSFSGAFQVLLGSSLHSEYSFREDRRFNEHFLVGQISLRDVELLQTGSLKQILPGPRYIHSLFHLDHPSATVVIRTERSASAPIQYDYRKPCVAIDPFFKDPQTFRKLQTIRLLLSTNYEQADAMLCDLLSASDVQTTFLALGTIFRHLRHDPLEKLFELSRTAPRLRAVLRAPALLTEKPSNYLSRCLTKRSVN